MKTVHVAFVLLFLSLCSAWWVERIDVIVFDAEGRPLPGAEVTVVWQIDYGKRTSLTYTTNSSGVAHFYMSNVVTEEALVERQYTIRATYAGASASTVGFVGRAANYTIRLPVVGLSVRTFDALGRALSGVVVDVEGITRATTTAGLAWVRVPAGQTLKLTACYGEVCARSEGRGTRDFVVNITLGVWDIAVRAYNEWEQRIEATIRYDNTTRTTTPYEPAVLERFPSARANVTIEVKNKTRAIEIVAGPEVEIYVDLSPPVIRDVRTAPLNGNVKISAKVADLGPRAAGLAAWPALRWRSPNGSWAEQRMYPAADEFDTIVHAEGKGFEFQIIAVDRQNNTAVYGGNFSFVKEMPKEEEKAPPSPAAQPPPVRIGLVHIVEAAVVLLIIVILYRRLRG